MTGLPSLESPLALLVGLTIPAILALWMLRPRRPRRRVPSLLFWPGSPAERQAAHPWQKIRSRPLLWLQLLAAVLLALAAARPFLPATPAARHLIVLLDASGSMQARDVTPDRFAAAKAEVANLARQLGPDQEMTVIRLDARPSVLIANARQASAVLTALADQRPGFGPADFAAGIALAAGLSQRNVAEWVLVSDGGLTVPSDAQLPPGVQFRDDVVGTAAGNVAVAGLAVRESGGTRTVQAQVQNLGSKPASGTLRLLAEGHPVSEQSWRAEANASTFLTWTDLPAGPRWYEAALAGVDPAANALATDDQAWVALAATSTPSVLLVSAGNSFLERLLGVYDNLRPFQATPTDWPTLAKSDSGYALTIFDRLWPDQPARGNALLIGPPVGAEFRPGQVWLKPDQPLLRSVDWSDVHVGAAHKLPLDSSWEAVVDSDGGPLLAVRDQGGRREAALAFSLSDSDLALRPAFPVLMANLLAWLLPSTAGAPSRVAPGGSLAIDASPLAKQVWVESTDGQREDLAPPWPPRPFQPGVPGLYTLVQETDAATQQGWIVANGYAPSEADLTPRQISLAASAAAPAPPSRGSLVLWPWLAAAILVLSIGEWWIEART